MFVSRVRELGAAPVVALVVVLFLSGCTSSDEKSGEALTRVSPARFAAAIDDTGTLTLNVHTPEEGSIQGTDATIPFDRLRARADELPADKSTPIAVYCRSGNMSAVATVTLSDLGYTRIIELEGGMEAWQDDGRDLLPTTSQGAQQRG